jgi:MFS family permease
LVAGALFQIVWVQLLVLSVWTLGMSFTWPALEASTSESSNRLALPRLVGIYNLVWAGTAAVAYFSGGAMLEAFGARSSFLIPALLHLCQLLILAWPSRPNKDNAMDAVPSAPPAPLSTAKRHPLAPAFLKMAWLANPCAYVAMNCIIPTIPYIAKKFALSPMLAGFFCSVWLFSRLAAFLGLWLWPGWHYRARWMLAAFFAMIACFVTLLVAPNLWLVLLAQIIFGVSVGLLYYSSLYYSMDVGDTKGEHGGLHEAAIGLGNLAGPAISSAALHLFPAQINSGAWSVGGFLTVGLAILFYMSWKVKTPQPVSLLEE